jgi:DNA-binding transcriptional LysR family regulator
MTFEDLRVFCAVAAERSFSRAARKLRRTQPAVSQAIRRLETAAGERLIDRSSRDGTLTDAGQLLLEYGTRLLHLADEATMAVGALREVRKGRVLIGANDGGVYPVLPLIAAFQEQHPAIVIDVRRIASRQMAQEILLRSVDFGVLTFNPPERELHSVVVGIDELVLLVRPDHAFARRTHVTMEEMGREAVIAHNDPSPTRDRVLRMYEQRHAPLNIRLALPSLDAIKRAVEMGMGVALLPRRCAQGEIGRGDLVGIAVPDLQAPRQVRLVHRADAGLSHAARAFLDLARALSDRGPAAPAAGAGRRPRAQAGKRSQPET